MSQPDAWEEFDATCEVCGRHECEDLSHWGGSGRGPTPTSATRIGFHFQSAAEIFAEPDKRPLCEDATLGVQKIADSLNVIFGHTGDGKTQLAMLQILAQMTGQRIANLVAPERGAIVYHDLEWTLPVRLKAAAVHYRIDPTTLPIVRPGGYLMDLADPATVRLYVEDLKRHEIRPIEHIFDTTARAANYDENTEGSKIVRAADYIREHAGGAVTLITHPSKSDPDHPRGGNQIEGAADMVIRVQKSEAGLVTVTGTKTRFGAPDQVLGQYRMVEVPEVTWGVTLRPAGEVIADQPQALVERDRKVLDALPGAGARYSEWCGLAASDGVSASQFGRSVRALLARHVTKRGEVYHRV
jgi:hypothetical protein